MDATGQDKHLFILELYCVEAPGAKKINSGMYMSALNTVGVSHQKGGAKRGVRWEGVETLTASLQDVRIFLMPSDIAGIYNSRGELTRLAVAHTVPKSQLHIFRGNSGKNTKLCKYLKHHQLLLKIQ